MYYPNLKTSDAELRAISHLSTSAKRGMVPVFELTRSRKTKALPDGSLLRRLHQLKDLYGAGAYILDLCTQEELMNSETVALFSEDHGYGNWTSFLSDNVDRDVVPCLLYVDGGSRENFQKQAVDLQRIFGKVCLRTSASDELTPRLMIWLSEVVPQSSIIVCGILYYIEPGRLDYYKEVCQNFMREVVGNRSPAAILFPSSSFPRYITELPGCDDDAGSFRSQELVLETWLQMQFPNRKIQPSDFASVHPVRYPASGGNWVPRIDIFDGGGFQYLRIRRDDGGYREAAKAITSDQLSNLPDCWGRDQIEAARRGAVAGGSPSYWISVRINSWLSARAQP